jgi:hypothetical protein
MTNEHASAPVREFRPAGRTLFVKMLHSFSLPYIRKFDLFRAGLVVGALGEGEDEIGL